MPARSTARSAWSWITLWRKRCCALNTFETIKCAPVTRPTFNSWAPTWMASASAAIITAAPIYRASTPNILEIRFNYGCHYAFFITAYNLAPEPGLQPSLGATDPRTTGRQGAGADALQPAQGHIPHTFFAHCGRSRRQRSPILSARVLAF